MSAITTFPQSDQALKILGLPGGAQKERPVGFVIAEDEANLGGTIDTFVAVLSGDIG